MTFSDADQIRKDALDLAKEIITHCVLVGTASRWLEKIGCGVVITEMACLGGEQPDAIGWKGGKTILVECKASRADFKRDKHKIFRQKPEFGAGHVRYFLSPPGVISEEELPEKWGLLVLQDGRVRKVKKAAVFQQRNPNVEIYLLLSALRRIGQTAPTGVSIKCYTIKSRNRTTLGIREEAPPSITITAAP